MNIRQYILEYLEDDKLKAKMIDLAKKQHGKITPIGKNYGFTRDAELGLVFWFDDKFGSAGIVREQDVI